VKENAIIGASCPAFFDFALLSSTSMLTHKI
jgi:hypothetical protein